MLLATLLFSLLSFDLPTSAAGGEDVDVVRGGEAIVYTTTFRAGQEVRVTVVGDGSSDLDLVIFGPADQIVDRDIDLTDRCVAQFVAPTDGSYRIAVLNVGQHNNLYTIRVVD